MKSCILLFSVFLAFQSQAFNGPGMGMCESKDGKTYIEVSSGKRGISIRVKEESSIIEREYRLEGTVSFDGVNLVRKWTDDGQYASVKYKPSEEHSARSLNHVVLWLSNGAERIRIDTECK